MKKRISLLLVFVLALALVLTSCGECTKHTDADFDQLCDNCGADVPCEHIDADKDALCDNCKSDVDPAYIGMGYYNTDYESDSADALALAAKIDTLKNMTYSTKQGNLVLFRNYSAEKDEPKAAVLNVDTGAIVYTAAMEDDEAVVTKSVSIVNMGICALIVETTTDETDEYSVNYTTKLFTALGKEFASKTAKSSIYISEYENILANGWFVFDGKVYSIEDDVATYKFDKGFVEIPYCDYYTDKYNYDQENGMIHVYDQSFKLVTSYVISEESSLDYIGYGVLADGNIVIQYAKTLLGDAAEYDIETIIMSPYAGAITLKQDIITVIYNVETKAETKVDVDYVIDFDEGIVNEYNDEFFTEFFVPGKLTNVAQIYKIVDKKIDENNELYVNLGNDLRVMSYLAQEIPNQDGFAYLIDDNRFVVMDKAEKIYLINEKGEVLGEVTDADDSYESMLFDESTGKLYNSSLQLILDSATIDYEYVDGNDYYTIMVDTYEVPAETEGADPTVKNDYYLLNFANASVFTKLTLTDDEVETLEFYNRYYTYETVVKEEEIDRNYTVYCNTAGQEIFRLMTDSVTVTSADGKTTTTTSDYVASTYYLDDSVMLRVCTYVYTYNVETGYSSTSTYNFYLAK